MIEKKDETVNDVVKEKAVKPTSKKSILINFAVILTIFICLFVYMLKVDGLDNIISLIKGSDPMWVLVGVLCMIAFWLCEAICLHIPFQKIFHGQKFRDTFRISMLGQLFNNITPFSSGGQPMQAYEMSKDGRKMSDAMSVLVIKFIISQSTLVLFTAIVLVFQWQYFTTLVSNFLLLAIVGFAVNIGAIVFIILMGVNQKLVLAIIKPFYFLLGKIGVFKNVDERIAKLMVSVDNFSKQFAIMKEQKWMIIKMTIISFIQYLAYYYITYAVYRAFGNNGVSVFNIIPAQAFLMMIMAFTPVPGASIAAEGGFLLLFQSIFQKGTLNMSLLFWRVYTFYLPIVVGAFFLIRLRKNDKKRRITDEQKVELTNEI